MWKNILQRHIKRSGWSVKTSSMCCRLAIILFICCFLQSLQSLQAQVQGTYVKIGNDTVYMLKTIDVIVNKKTGKLMRKEDTREYRVLLRRIRKVYPNLSKLWIKWHLLRGCNINTLVKLSRGLGHRDKGCLKIQHLKCRIRQVLFSLKKRKVQVKGRFRAQLIYLRISHMLKVKVFKKVPKAKEVLPIDRKKAQRDISIRW